MSGWFRKMGQEKPWAQGCVIFCAGCLLAATGCFGFLVSLDYNGNSHDSLKEVAGFGCGVAFVLGAIALPVGFIWWIVGMIKANRKREAAEKAGVGDAPPPTLPE